MRQLILLLVLLALNGCSAFALDQLSAEGAMGSAVCITGSGPPMTGGGNVAGAKVNEGFAGSIRIFADCAMEIVVER